MIAMIFSASQHAHALQLRLLKRRVYDAAHARISLSPQPAYHAAIIANGELLSLKLPTQRRSCCHSFSASDFISGSMPCCKHLAIDIASCRTALAISHQLIIELVLCYAALAQSFRCKVRRRSPASAHNTSASLHFSQLKIHFSHTISHISHADVSGADRQTCFH
jgi:hypothetical protein